jgi:hypothetical protein
MDTQVNSADVSIATITGTATRHDDHVKITTEISVHCENDDDARNVRLVVVLPPTSHVLSTTPPAAIGPSFAAVGPPSDFVQSQPTQGYVLFQIGDLPPTPGSNANDPHFELVSRVHESWATSPIAAFVSSDVPDPHPENNCGSYLVELPPKHRHQSSAVA